MDKVNYIPRKLKWLFALFGLTERDDKEKIEWQKEQMEMAPNDNNNKD